MRCLGSNHGLFRVPEHGITPDRPRAPFTWAPVLITGRLANQSGRLSSGESDGPRTLRECRIARVDIPHPQGPVQEVIGLTGVETGSHSRSFNTGVDRIVVEAVVDRQVDISCGPGQEPLQLCNDGLPCSGFAPQRSLQLILAVGDGALVSSYG